MATWPAADDLEAWLRIPEGSDTAARDVALAGAKSQIAARTIYAESSGTIPDALRMACLLQASKLYHRRNTPDGVQGNAEFGLIRTNRFDGDVVTLIEPFLEVVCAIDDGEGDSITDIEDFLG